MFQPCLKSDQASVQRTLGLARGMMVIASPTPSVVEDCIRELFSGSGRLQRIFIAKLCPRSRPVGFHQQQQQQQ